jgi:hypothetical protein
MAMFKAVTDSGNVLQIGDNWMGYAFIQRLTVTTTARTESSDVAKEGGVVANTRAWSFTITGDNPIVAVAGNNSAVLLGRAQNGASFTFTGWCGVGADGASAVNSFTVYVFDRPSLVGQGKYLRIRNGAGQVLFDATCKYMRVVGLIDTAGGVSSVTLPSGKTYGALLGGSGGKMVAEALSHGSESLWRTRVVVSRMTVNVADNVVATNERSFYNYVNYSSSIPTSVPRVGTYGDNNILSPILDLTGYL